MAKRGKGARRGGKRGKGKTSVAEASVLDNSVEKGEEDQSSLLIEEENDSLSEGKPISKLQEDTPNQDQPNASALLDTKEIEEAQEVLTLPEEKDDCPVLPEITENLSLTVENNMSENEKVPVDVVEEALNEKTKSTELNDDCQDKEKGDISETVESKDDCQVKEKEVEQSSFEEETVASKDDCLDKEKEVEQSSFDEETVASKDGCLDKEKEVEQSSCEEDTKFSKADAPKNIESEEIGIGNQDENLCATVSHEEKDSEERKDNSAVVVDFLEVVEEMCEDISQGDEMEALEIKDSDDEDEEVQYIDEEIVDDDRKENDTKFEEISDESINEEEEQMEAIIEMESEGQEIGEKSSEHITAVLKDKNNEAESLEAVFLATENDNGLVSVEDKDNEYISDASLSVDNDLSLEEISDDESDVSRTKKRRKSIVQTPEKKDTDSSSLKDETSEVKKDIGTDNINTKKRSLSEKEEIDVEAKKICLPSEEKTPTTDTEIKTTDSNDAAFYTGVCGKAKVIVPVPKKNKIVKKNPVKSRSLSTEKAKKEFKEVSCQSQKINMKGKIVQCSINPVKPSLNYSYSRVCTFQYQKFKSKIPASISEQVFCAVTSAAEPAKGKSFDLTIYYDFHIQYITLSRSVFLRFYSYYYTFLTIK